MVMAPSGHTAAEIVASRADSTQPYMGLTGWSGSRPSKEDTGIAKNYLNQDELDTLNRIVSFYLDFAELQAKSRRPMYMKDWLVKLDDFLRLSERDILTHAGGISHEAALEKAYAEFEKFRALEASKPSPVEKHFQKAIEQVKRLEKGRNKKDKPPSKPAKRKKGRKIE